jgi:translation initiation factor 1 (eIF-1/SUI1)
MGSVVKSATKAVGKVVTSVLGIEKPQTPESVQTVLASPPQVDPVKPMPVSDDAAVRNAQRQSIAEQRRRRGRTSTILTAADEALGG